jgi:hypothetical protein
VLVEQIGDEFLPRISGKVPRWIHETQGRGRGILPIGSVGIVMARFQHIEIQYVCRQGTL